MNGKTQDLPVLVSQDGKLSIKLPEVDIPNISDYYVVDSTKKEANAIPATFDFTKDGTLTFENTVKYAPVKQELQIKVYDDESGKALTDVTTSFTGNSKSDFPADVATNLEALKAYYESKNYVVETLPAATGKFDSTDNGSGADKQVQVLEVHLKHAKDVKTESIKVVREVTYSVDSKSPDAPKAPDAKVDTFDGVFSRTVTTDKVNGNVTKSDWSGTYNSDGVTSPKLADGYHPDKEVAAKATISADFLKNAGEDKIAKLMSDGLKVSDEVVYSADKQTVKIRVYDDTTDSKLSPVTAKSELEGQGKNVEISLDGLTNSDIPDEFSDNINLLKSYYESKGYKFVSNTDIPAKFDATSNGTGQTDSTPQYVDIHLEHTLNLEKETKSVTRTINYYDQNQNKLINGANPKVTEAPTIEQKVDFERYAVRDQVTKQIIGYATPDQVTTTGDQTTLKQADSYTHTTGEASDATAGFVIASDSKTLPSQINYDLSKYGYEPPTTADGQAFAQVDEVTPKVTDEDTVVNVYYREKVVTVTVDTPPTEGQTVPGTDAKFPANDWSAQKATNTSTRTIHYIYDEKTFVNGGDVSGQPVPGLNDIKQKVNFTQSAEINLVTGEVSYQGDWKATSSSTTDQKRKTITNKDGSYAQVVSPSSKNGYPELKGYTPHSETVDAVEAIHGTDAGDVYVKYVANKSLVQIEYSDEDTGDVIKLDKPEGTSGERLVYSTDSAIRDFEKQGYELVHDGFTDNDHNLNKETFDSYDDVPNGQYPENINQKWTVTLKHKKITVTSEQPKSTTDKITDDHGYDHNYPAGVDQADLNNTVTRTISSKYSDKDGAPWGPVDQNVSYKRDATIDLVKLHKKDADAVTYTNWEPTEAGKESFDSMPVTHVEPGYVADYQVVPNANVTKDQDGKAQNGQNIVVTYSPVGVIIPVDKDGNEIPGAPNPKYNNDEKDPTKVTTTHVPKIPGYHPAVPSVTPDKPADNTQVVYVKNTQAIDLVYVDVNDPAKQVTLETQTSVAQGDSDSAIPASVAETMNSTLQSYLDKGYVLDSKEDMPSTFDNSDQNADGSDSEHQVVTVYLKHGTEVVSGKDPKTPGTAINEKDPNGVKYPDAAGKDNLVIASQNTVHYVDGKGNPIPGAPNHVEVDPATLTRTVTIDKVTGQVLKNSNWEGEKPYGNVSTPVVNGYFANAKEAGAVSVTKDDVDNAENGVIKKDTTVTYHPLGHIIPVDETGNPIPGADTPIFNNDPNDPTKAGSTDTPVLTGYHLNDSSETSITPDDPGVNREVVYVRDTQKLVVQVFDLDDELPNEPLDTSKTGAKVDFEGGSFTDFPADVATNIAALKDYYAKRGYVVTSEPDEKAMTDTFDSNKDETQYLKLKLKHGTVTFDGNNDKDLENLPKSGDSINPDDPDSVKYPADVDKNNLVISSEVIVRYKGAGDKTPEDNIRTDEKTLTRKVTIDKVTGKVVKAETTDWTAGPNAHYDLVSVPVIPGYLANIYTAGETTIEPKDAAEAKDGKITREFKVVYTPDMQQLILKVHDQDTDTDLEAPITYGGFSDESVGNDPVNKMSELIKKYQELGYDLVSVPIIDQKYDTTSNYGQAEDSEPQTFMLVLKHHVETVTPDQPKTPTDVIPGTSQNYPSGVDKSDLSKTITRTIIVNLPDSTTKEIKQVVEYGRTATVDAVTKEVKYSDWTTKQSNWPQYDAPGVPGYTPDKEVVDLTHVPVDGKDVTVEINYVAVPDEPDTPSEPDTPLTPVTPTTPDKPDKPAKPEKANKPSKPEKPAKPHTNKPEAQAISDRAKSDKAPEGLTSTEWAHMSLAERERYLKGQALAKHDDKADSGVLGRMDDRDANKLPQTGNRSGLQLTLLGLGLISLALFGLKKKRDDE